MTLTATALNPVTREWMPDVVVQLLRDGYVIRDDTTDETGQVTFVETYPAVGGAHTFSVRVAGWNGEDIAQQMVTQPVTLLARGFVTTFSLTVTRDPSSLVHTISGSFLVIILLQHSQRSYYYGF